MAAERRSSVSTALSSASPQAQPLRPMSTRELHHMRKPSHELVDALDQRFFTPDFDPVAHLFERLPAQLTGAMVEKEISEIDITKDVVSHRLYKQVMSNYNNFVDGMRHVREVQLDLGDISRLLTSGRKLLDLSSKGLTSKGLGLVHASRRYQRAGYLRAALSLINRTFNEEDAMEEHLRKGELAEAVARLATINGNLQKLNGYKCLDDLRVRVVAMRETLKDRIAQELSKLAVKFNLPQYRNLLRCFFGLDPQSLVESFRKAYSAAMEQAAVEAVFEVLPQSASDVPHSSLRDALRALKSERFAEAYQRVLRVLNDVMYSFYRADESLQSLGTEMAKAEKEGASPPHDMPPVPAAAVERARQELTRSRDTVWGRAMDLASAVLASITMTTATIPVEDFVHVLFLSRQFVSIGEQFSQSNSFRLQSTLQFKSKEYVANFHRDSFDYIRQLLENELWKPVPLPENFGPEQIKELRMVQNKARIVGAAAAAAAINPNSLVGSAASQLLPQLLQEEAKRLFSDFTLGVNAFVPTADDDDNERVERLREEEAKRLQRRRELDTEDKGAEDERAATQRFPVVTQSSLNIAKAIGKYINIMQTLRPYALNTLHGLAEIFDFYVYVVFNLLGPGANRFYQIDFLAPRYARLRSAMLTIRQRIESGEFGKFELSTASQAQQVPVFLSVKLGTPFLSSLPRSNLSSHDVTSAPNRFDARGNFVSKITSSKFNTSDAPVPVKLNSKVDLNAARNLYGIVERYSAAEALNFLVLILEQMEHRIALLLPKEEQHRAARFIAYASTMREELGLYMVRNLATLLVNMEPVISAIGNVKWDRTTISTAHNSYVDKLVASLHETDQLLRELGANLHESHRLVLWREAAVYVMEQLLEGFSRVKKCTTEGRALMSVDLNEIRQAMESISGLRPLPLFQHVNRWINAFYNPTEEDYLTFVRTTAGPTGYTLAQYLSVANTGISANMKKKDKELFLQRVEEEFNKGLSAAAAAAAETASREAGNEDLRTSDTAPELGSAAAYAAVAAAAAAAAPQAPVAAAAAAAGAAPPADHHAAEGKDAAHAAK